MTTKKKIVVIIEKTDTGFSAYTKENPVYTTGATMNELPGNINEAFTLYFEDKKYNARQIAILLRIADCDIISLT